MSLATVQYWVRRAADRRLDRVDWTDRPRVPHTTGRAPAAIEDLVSATRRELAEDSDLGACGAVAIHQALHERGYPDVPSVRTIGRILRRRGARDARRRVRRPPPPRGWYLADVAARRAELDSFDVVEGLVIKGGTDVEVLNATSLHGGLAGSWPRAGSMTAKAVTELAIAHWEQVGLPQYAQFDNGTIFQGPHQHADVIGRVSRLCRSLEVVPVFVPPQEPGFQAMIENYNGQWQAKVWTRFTHESLEALQGRSERYVTALHRRRADRIESAPSRRPFPRAWRLDLQARPRGRIVYLRRTDPRGWVDVLGHRFEVNEHWVNRLVRIEVDLDRGRLRFHSLRRREPTMQPLLKEIDHHIPNRRFKE